MSQLTLVENSHEIVDGFALDSEKVLDVEASVFGPSHQQRPVAVRVQQVHHLPRQKLFISIFQWVCFSGHQGLVPGLLTHSLSLHPHLAVSKTPPTCMRWMMNHATLGCTLSVCRTQPKLQFWSEKSNKLRAHKHEHSL